MYDFKSEQNMAIMKVKEREDVNRDVNIVISLDDVRSHFKRVNPCKAPGPDKVSCRVLRACAEQLAQPFQKLFQW